MNDEQRRPEQPGRGPGTPSPSREEGRAKPRRVSPDDLEKVVGGVMTTRNLNSPFDEPQNP